MYESLRQLIRHSQTSEAAAAFAAMDLAFAIDLCKEEGSGQVMRTVVGIFAYCMLAETLHAMAVCTPEICVSILTPLMKDQTFK